MRCNRMISAAATLTLSAALLVSCGSSSASASTAPSSVPASSVSAVESEENGAKAVNLDTVFDTLCKTNPISNPFTLADMNIEYDFMLDKADVVSYKGVKSNDNGDAGLVLVIQAAEGKAKSIADALADYQEEQVAFYGNYAEFAGAQANVRDGVISTAGNIVVMVFASNECDKPASLSAAVASALR